MNERILKLYDQAIILEGNGDYVTGELDPFKFAELIVRECANYAYSDDQDHKAMLKHFGVEELKHHFGVEE